MYDITNLLYFSCYICAKYGVCSYFIRMQVLIADTGEVKTLPLAFEGFNYSIYVDNVFLTPLF